MNRTRRGRPTQQEVERRDSNERLLTCVGRLDVRTMEGMVRLRKLLEAYRADGCTEVKVYVRRID